jgi:hypothetical protein
MKIDLPKDGSPEQATMRRLSRATFGAGKAFEAFLVMAHEDRFYGSQIAKATGCEVSYAAALLRKLDEAGLVEPLEREGGQVRKYYQRRPSPFWQLVRAWGESILAPAETSTSVARIADINR